MGNRVRLGAFEADLDSYELFRGSGRVAIQRQPFQLLAVLIERAGELVTRETLCRRLWPGGVIVDFEHSLNAAVRKIRRALGDPPERPRIVETIPGRGFRLCIPVERCESQPIWQCRSRTIASDVAPAQPRDSLAETLRQIALSLGAELLGDPAGAVASQVAALFVGSEDAYRSAQELRHRAKRPR